MNFTQIPDEPDAIVWQDELGNSGVSIVNTPGWETYQAWLAAGNKPTSIPTHHGTLETVRERVLSEINVAVETALAPITSRYPRSEIDSWAEQCLEARSWLADASSRTPLVDAIAGTLSPALKKEFCQSILAKADSFKVAVGGVIAWRRAVTLWVEQQVDQVSLFQFAPAFPEVPHAS